jgi:2-aminoethylphosphonate-pyruvate transaminase
MNTKLLFTPGPLTTSEGVKQAMLHDLGSRDPEFLEIVRDIRRRLLALGGAVPGEFECVLMQGSGTFAIESVISSAIPRGGRLLVLVNGAYGRRIAQIARVHGIALDVFEIPEDRKFEAAMAGERLAASSGITHVALVHCETTTGLLNPLAEIGPVVQARGAALLVDAMSSFGAVPVDLATYGIDYLVSSANKCIEGVPGFGFVLARRSALERARGQARTLSLDLHAQWAGLETDGQFRLRPPRMRCWRFTVLCGNWKQKGAWRVARRATAGTARCCAAEWRDSASPRTCARKTRATSSRPFDIPPHPPSLSRISTGS